MISSGSWLCLLLLVTSLSMTALAAGQTQSAPSTLWVYVGTYNQRGSEGIYLCHLDLATGKLDAAVLVAKAANPSFLAIHPTRPLLVACNEVAQLDGAKGGAVSSFSIDPASGKLTLINHQSTGGPGTCHVTFDHTGRWVLAANYSGGSFCDFPIDEQGKLGERVSFHQHHGSSVNPNRQREPHAHSVNVDPTNHFAFVADLGIDKVMILPLRCRNRYARGQRSGVPCGGAGLGPPASGHPPQRPPGLRAQRTEIHRDRVPLRCLARLVGGDRDRAGSAGRLQGVEHRGRGAGPSFRQVPLHLESRPTTASRPFAIDEQTGKLRLVGRQSTQGKTPRNFAIDPAGKYLVVANEDSDNLVVLAIDPATGTLRPTGNSLSIAAPVCVRLTAPLGTIGTK